MKYIITLLFFIAILNLAKSNNISDSLLLELDAVILNKDFYLNEKMERINTIKDFMKMSNHKASDDYNGANLLYEEYKAFNYDSAAHYAYYLLDAANHLNENNKISEAKIKLSLLLLSAGMFSETLSMLNTVDSKHFNDTLHTEYYKLFARTYFDMADYADGNRYWSTYNNLGYEYIDSALCYTPKESYNYYSIKGLKFLRLANVDSAIYCYEKLINEFDLSSRQYAIEASSLSFIYYNYYSDRKEESMQLLIKAAIEDVKYSIKETTAIRDLADRLFKLEDNDRAYSYIRLALDEAYFYGAKHRKSQISNILPIIEQKQIEIIRAQKSKLLNYSIILLSTTIFLLLLAVVVFIQKGKLKASKKYITKNNANLKLFNEKLEEANHIKEEYIGHFFKTISEYISKIEDLKKTIHRKIAIKRLDEISDIITRINLKKEREELFQSFDQIFLSIFPDFIATYNTLLKEGEDPITLENNSLGSEMRIFALIRLGINENEKIAEILNFSMNTVYTYKARIKNKLNVTTEEFEKIIKSI